MNILILGCSFGVENDRPHTETFLKNLGHSVYNCSQNAGSNVNSFRRARLFLSGYPISHPRTVAYTNKHTEYNKNVPETIQLTDRVDQIHWIIWFHTELIRDIHELQMYHTMDEITNHVYSEFKILKEELNAKVAVIGGAGPIHPNFFNYVTPDFCIQSWFNEILQLGVPQIQTLSKPEYIERMNDVGLAKKIELLDQHLEIKKLLEDSPDFPDNYHPGERPHKELVNQLITKFQ
jgi:hypothetical protein